MPAQPSTSTAIETVTVETELAKSQKRAALGLLGLAESGRAGRGSPTVKLYQWAMGNLKTDGIIGPRTRARALALGALVPAATTDVPRTDPERL